jgi:uncharacterized protein (TIGR02453 family)
VPAKIAADTALRKDTFLFFRDLGKNNNKPWMDKHRERYKECLVQPCRNLFDELAPSVLQLDANFDVCGRTGANFSRINRDIRFAKDKTPYKNHMYVKFEIPSAGDRESGQLYVGLTSDTITVGFRMYCGPKRKASALALIAEPRVLANPKWLTKQKKRLARKFDSYWYTIEKGEWTKHEGWPTDPAIWKKIQAWIVRKKMTPAAATRPGFSKEVLKVFRDLYPLLKFTSIE